MAVRAEFVARYDDDGLALVFEGLKEILEGRGAELVWDGLVGDEQEFIDVQCADPLRRKS